MTDQPTPSSLRQQTDNKSYPEFAKFMQNCHDGVASTYTAADTDQVLYNKQAVEDLVQADRQRLADEIMANFPEQQPPVKVEDINDGDDLSDMIYLGANKKGHNECLEACRQAVQRCMHRDNN